MSSGQNSARQNWLKHSEEYKEEKRKRDRNYYYKNKERLLNKNKLRQKIKMNRDKK